MEKDSTRRNFLIGAGLSAAALITASCGVEPSPTPESKPQTLTPKPQTPTPSPSETLTPTISATPTDAETQLVVTKEPNPDQPIWDLFLPEITHQIENLHEYHANIVFTPVEKPESGINFGGDVIITAASVFKPTAVMRALLGNPKLSLEPGSDAYRSLVSSNNSATARILQQIGSFDVYNRYLHETLNFPGYLGLTEWGYPPTLGWKTTEVTDLIPGTPLCKDGFSNPYTLNAALSVYQVFENMDSYFPQKDRLREILSISDPEYKTPLDLAINRAKIRHPDKAFFYYGKNGTLTHLDWARGKDYNVEAVILFVNGRTFNLAYSAETFDVEDLLDSVLDLAAALSV